MREGDEILIRRNLAAIRCVVGVGEVEGAARVGGLDGEGRAPAVLTHVGIPLALSFIQTKDLEQLRINHFPQDNSDALNDYTNDILE